MTASSLTAALLLAGNEGCLSVVHISDLISKQNSSCSDVKAVKESQEKLSGKKYYNDLK